MKTSRSEHTKLEDLLRRMKGLKWLYGTMEVVILSWRYDGEYVTIATTGTWITEPVCDASHFLKTKFMEMEQDGEIKENANLALIEENLPKVPEMKLANRLDELGDFMFTQMTKIADNPAYAQHQAPQINLTAKNIIDAAKTQITHFEAVNNAIRNR